MSTAARYDGLETVARYDRPGMLERLTDSTALAVLLGMKPGSTQEAIEFLSTKVGLVLLVLGAMHFFNVFVIAKWGKRAAEAIRA